MINRMMPTSAPITLPMIAVVLRLLIDMAPAVAVVADADADAVTVD